MRDTMDSIAKDRGRVVHYFWTESDCHAPALLTPEAYRRWKRAKFGKRLYVLFS
jgi:hypothetical protein